MAFNNSMASLADWLFSGKLIEFPKLKLAYSEGQIGWVPYLLVVCLLFVVILFAGVAPDVMKHSGQHWTNPSADLPAQQGAPTKHE